MLMHKKLWDGKIDDDLPVIGVDTEYDNNGIPFLGTTCDEQLKHKLYNLRRPSSRAKFKKLCENRKLVKIFHSITADMKALSNIDIEVLPPYSDTMILSSICNENYKPKKLKYLAQTLIKEPCLEDKELSKVKAKYKREAKKEGREFSFSDIPVSILYPYAKRDPEYCIKLYYYFQKPIQKYLQVYQLELSLIPIIAQMQCIGFEIDRKFVKEKMDEIEIKLEKLKRYFIRRLHKKDIKFYNPKEVEVPFKPTSPKHIARYIELTGIPIKERTPKGAICTLAKNLEKHTSYRFIFNVLKFRKLAKQLTTYYAPLYNKYTSKTNNVASFQYWQSGAKTGRFSAELIQTIPRTTEVDKYGINKDVRKAFVPRKGFRYLLVDYNQVEMRLFAHFSGCDELVKAINEGLDIHTYSAYKIFGKKRMEKSKAIGKKLRFATKTINFGIIYGIGIAALSELLKMSRRETREHLQAYYAAYPIKEFMQGLSNTLYKQGYITLTLKSKLMDFTRDYRVPQHLAYRSANTTIQGTAAYIIKCALLRVGKEIIFNYSDINILATIHDELIFEIPKTYNIKKIARVLVGKMEDYETFKVKITASCKVSDKSWGDAKTLNI
jgi:DNA polymerase-1